MSTVSVLGREINVKIVTLPDGSTRFKPEFDDVVAVAREMGRTPREVLDLAMRELPRS
jgi:uncharacterized protein (DUF111 family)